jgi:hypothetical protein
MGEMETHRAVRGLLAREVEAEKREHQAAERVEALEARIAVLERHLAPGIARRKPIRPPEFPSVLRDLGLSEPL